MSGDHNHRALTGLYHPVEHKILSDYLKVEPLVPVGDIDVRKQPPGKHDYICVEKDAWGRYTDISLENAVARICLEHVQGRLPWWGFVDENGEVVRGRPVRPKTSRRIVSLPRRLFSINWANTAPGISWPEVYHVTHLFEYEHHIITSSRDSSDAFGYAEEAVGAFPAEDSDLLESAGTIIRRWWQERYNMDGGQPPWEEFLGAGQVDENTAEQWAFDSWGGRENFDDVPDWYQERLRWNGAQVNGGAE